MTKTLSADPLSDYHAMTGRMASIAMEIKARKGELVFCPPVGYRIDVDGPRAKAVPDSVLAPLVREAFERYAAGDCSLRKLLKTMTERGLVSRSGKPMGVSALHAVLINPFYCGQVRWGGELLDGGHEALITREMFQEVQIKLMTNGCGRGQAYRKHKMPWSLNSQTTGNSIL